MDPRQQMQNYGPMTPPGYPGGTSASNSYSQSNGYPSLAQVGPQNQNTMGYGPGTTSCNMQYMPGRFVTSEDEIVAREVPMDGCPAVFPQKDLSCVYLKQWNNRGTIDTVRYILEKKPDTEKAASNEFHEEVLNRLTRLEELMTKPKGTSTGSGRTKNKPGTEEETE